MENGKIPGETLYAIKAFRVINGELCSLFATGAFARRYALGQWTSADPVLLGKGLGLFAFSSFKSMKEAYANSYADGNNKINILDGPGINFFVCKAEGKLPLPEALVSFNDHNPTNVGLSESLEHLDSSLLGLLEKGAVVFTKLCPIFKISLH